MRVTSNVGACVCSVLLSACAMNTTAREAYPPVPGVSHEQIVVNNIDMHIAETGEGPLVILMHGFPELWYSWRHQIPALAEAGYHVVAPDMRGYGHTEQSSLVADYDVLDICGDIWGLIAYFGQDRAVLIGHDWGGALAIQCARLRPDSVRAVVDISVPYRRPQTDQLPLEFFRSQYGDRFFYILYLQEDAAERELNGRIAEVFRKFYASPSARRAPPAILDSAASAGGFLDRIGEPLDPPTWITPGEINYFVRSYERTGFIGGLNYYRNLDQNALILRRDAQPQFDGPALFIAGEEDFLLRGQSQTELEAALATVTPDVTVALLPSVGHWAMEEAPESVNTLLIQFLSSLDELSTTRP